MATTPEVIVDRLRVILAQRGACLCGSRESCEVCNYTSQYNKLYDKVYEAVYGPRRPMNVEDYGASIMIDLEGSDGNNA